MKTFEKWRRTSLKALTKTFKRRNTSSEPCPPILALEMINGQKTVACSECLTQLYVPTSTSLTQPRFRCRCGAVLIDPEYYVGRGRTESSGSTSTITLSPRQEDDADYESKVDNTNDTDHQDQGRTAEQAIKDAQEDWGILVTRSPVHHGSMEEEQQMEEKEEQENNEDDEEELEWVFVAVAEAVPDQTDQTMDEPSPKSLPESPMVHIPRAPPGETWVDEHHFPSDDDEGDTS